MKILLFVSTVMMALYGCIAVSAQQEDPTSKAPAAQPVTMHQFPGKPGYYKVTEICHDGITYLLTSQGGITAKIGTRLPAQTQYVHCN